MNSVAHVLSSLSLGGAERVVLDLASFQREEGLDAQILSLGSEQDFLVSAVRQSGIPVKFNTKGEFRISRYAKVFSYLRKFDVVHIHSRGAFKFIAPLFPLLYLCRIRVVYTRHGLLADNTPDFKSLYRILRPFITYVTFVTESGLDVFQENHNWSRDKLKVVRNGIRLPETCKKTVETPISLGSVGRMIPLKGQKLLLSAIQLISAEQSESLRRSTVLKFFGDGPLEQELKAESDRIDDIHIEFCGQQPDLEKLYKEIDVLIVASTSEGLSMVILEAMARGIPVIATNVGGNPTLVRNGETGILLPSRDKYLLRDAIVTLLENPELIERYGQAARSMIEAEFSLQRTHQKYLDCYGFTKHQV